MGVVVIISILVALVVPAVQAARIKAIEARVNGEIGSLETAIGGFKAKYGVEPPSQFSIYLSLPGWQGDPTAMAQVKRIWPQFDFNMAGGKGIAYPDFWPQVAALQPKNAVTFNTAEALLFFLGGVIDQPGAGQPPRGFARDPLHPFAPLSASPNREGPFFEFSDITRIKDIDGNLVNEWYDSIPNQSKPFMYFNSYDGRGYDLVEIDGNGTAIGIYTPQGAFVADSPHDVYRTTARTGIFPPATPQSGTGGTSADPTLAASYKSQTFQIISPGFDMEYGSGGIFNPALKNAGLVGYDTANGNTKLDPDTRQFDNLTNFYPGRLRP